MLYVCIHFRYFFTEIKTQTSSLILFGVCQEKKILRRRQTCKPATKRRLFVFIAVEKERQVFYCCQQNELVSFDVVFCDFKCTF